VVIKTLVKRVKEVFLPPTASSSGKSDQTLLKKLAFLLEENHRLKEEIRLLKASKDKTHDV